VNGILFPHQVNVTGGLPIPLTLVTESIEVNGGIDAELFEFE